MIVVKLTGGLGNQMFQYATGLALARRLGTEVLVDNSAYTKYKLHKYNLDAFKNKPDIAPNIYGLVEILLNNNFYKYLPKSLKYYIENKYFYKIYKENDFSYSTNINHLSGSRIKILGYFQSEKYFKQYRSEVVESFTFNDMDKKHELIGKIKKTNSVSVHIRRGDYLITKNLKVHGILDDDYYKKAYKFISKQVKNATFFAFSDDPDWVRQEFKFIPRLHVIKGDTRRPIRDMYLMSQCKHHVIANSSFSWWGAWLSQNQNQIVISPKKWFTDPSTKNPDIYCDGWIKL